MLCLHCAWCAVLAELVRVVLHRTLKCGVRRQRMALIARSVGSCSSGRMLPNTLLSMVTAPFDAMPFLRMAKRLPFGKRIRTIVNSLGGKTFVRKSGNTDGSNQWERKKPGFPSWAPTTCIARTFIGSSASPTGLVTVTYCSYRRWRTSPLLSLAVALTKNIFWVMMNPIRNNYKGLP